MSPRAALVALLLAFLADPAQADEVVGATCREGVDAALRRALAADPATVSASKGTLLQLDCMAVPNATDGALHAIASFRDEATRSYNDGGNGEGYAFVLATLDSGNRPRHHITTTAVEDALTLFLGGELRLDTSFHDVTPGGGVIGLAVTSSARGASAPDNRWSDEFALFVPEGKGFRRVLGLARHRQEALEGCVSMQCRGARWVDTTATLSPGERAASGWQRIDLHLEAEEIAVEPAATASAPTSTTLTLAYRDGAYRLDDGSPPPGSEYFFYCPGEGSGKRTLSERRPVYVCS